MLPATSLESPANGNGYLGDMDMTGVGDKTRSTISFASALAAMLLLAFCAGCDRKTGPQPPDLSACTRLEVTDPCGALNYVLSDTPLHAGLFNKDEKEWLKSYRKYDIADPLAIHAFADLVVQGIFLRHATVAPVPNLVTIACYRGDERVMFLWTQNVYIRVESWDIFRYASESFDLSPLRSPDLKSFQLRLDCGFQFARMTTSSMLFRRHLVAYPDPNRWCDLTTKSLCRLQGSKDAGGEDAIAGTLFRCPGMRQTNTRSSDRGGLSRVSHYAMNPECRPNSPDDTVLLFESQSGWNQHGGPELFSVDHHDPNGGCVLLNDGTVRFIRTREELSQLRWK
jgi:hypothetical protein